MSEIVWLYLMMGAYLLGVDHGQDPPYKSILLETVWKASLLLLWPAVLALGAVRMWRKRREG